MGTTVSPAGTGDRGGAAVVALTVLYSIELIGIVWAATVVTSLGRAHLGRGAGLLAVALLVAAALAGRGEFPAVDALFGTVYLPARRWPAQYGIDTREPVGYLRQLVWPLAS